MYLTNIAINCIAFIYCLQLTFELIDLVHSTKTRIEYLSSGVRGDSSYNSDNLHLDNSKSTERFLMPRIQYVKDYE